MARLKIYDLLLEETEEKKVTPQDMGGSFSKLTITNTHETAVCYLRTESDVSGEPIGPGEQYIIGGAGGGIFNQDLFFEPEVDDLTLRLAVEIL